MTVVVGAVVAAGGAFGVEVCFTWVEDGRGVDLFPCDVAAPEPAVEPFAAGTGICTGGGTGGGVTVLCGAFLPPPDDEETMTFAGGGAAFRDLIDGR